MKSLLLSFYSDSVYYEEILAEPAETTLLPLENTYNFSVLSYIILREIDRGESISI